MIEHELLLLGLLRESPKHGYDIKLKIQEILSLFAGVDLRSIYYPLRVLEKKGLLAKRIAKPGKRPQRFIYTLTPAGKNRFDELLTKSLLEVKRPQFSLDLSLYFLHYLKPEIARRRLRARQAILNRISRGLEGMIKNPPKKQPQALSRILEHNLKVLKAESEFLSSLNQSI
ncbi:MAG: PadR family transcriptional regulator [Candidatus Omnitrophota bacterium]